MASKINDIEDVERHLPGLLRATNEWFRIYKIPDGKPENQFAFSGEAKNKKYATEIVHECHEAWRGLLTGKVSKEGISCANVSVEGSSDKLSTSDPQYNQIPAHAPQPAAPVDASIDKWFFISAA